jgi:hypothetical protein
MKDLTKLSTAAYPPELKILRDSERERIIACAKAQAYYDQKFWAYIVEEERSWEGKTLFEKQATDYFSPRDEELDYTPTKLELGYPKYFIDEMASWMFENPVGLKVTNPDYHEALRRIHRSNLVDEKLMQSAQEGCLTGGIAVKVLYVPGLGVRLIFRPSRECFPLMDPDDADVMKKVHFCAYLDDDEHIWKQTFELVPWGQGQACKVTEAIYHVNSLGRSNPVPEKSDQEILHNGDRAIDFIPVQLIPNEPNLGDVWGKSDLEPLYSPINEICRKTSDLGDALKFELFPINILKNVLESEVDQFEIRPGALWNLVDGDSEHPASADKLESSMANADHVKQYVDMLKEALHLFSGVPQTTRDKVDATGQVSGVALKLMFTAIVSKSSRKLKYWLPRLERMYDYALRTASTYEGLDYDPEEFDLEVNAVPRVPQNEMEELEKQAKRIEMLVAKVVTVLQEQGIEDPEEYLAEVLTERRQIEDALNPDIYGAAIEQEAESFEEEPEE